MLNQTQPATSDTLEKQGYRITWGKIKEISPGKNTAMQKLRIKVQKKTPIPDDYKKVLVSAQRADRN